MNCRIASNGIALNLSALMDSGAGGEAFINQRLYDVIKQRLQPKFFKLKGSEVAISGYNNKKTGILSKIFQASLVIDKRCISTWFFFCDTGHHDILIGHKWFEKTGTLLDCANQKLVWPNDAIYNAQKDVTISQKELVLPPVVPSHQEDVNRRDRNMAKEVKKEKKEFKLRILQRPKEATTPSTPSRVSKPSRPLELRKLVM